MKVRGKTQAGKLTVLRVPATYLLDTVQTMCFLVFPKKAFSESSLSFEPGARENIDLPASVFSDFHARWFEVTAKYSPWKQPEMASGSKLHNGYVYSFFHVFDSVDYTVGPSQYQPGFEKELQMFVI